MTAPSITWSQLVAAALLGSDRQRLPQFSELILGSQPRGTGVATSLEAKVEAKVEASLDTKVEANLEANLEDLLRQVATSPAPEETLLNLAASLHLYHQAGQVPLNLPPDPLPPCDRDSQPVAPPRAIAYLHRLGAGEAPRALPELLDHMAEAGYRLPALLLPTLLNQAHSQAPLQTAIPPVLGKRGHWLASQHPDWQGVLIASDPGDALDMTRWETGKASQRLAYLRQLRRYHPDQARSLVAAGFNQDAAKHRAALLECFALNLGPGDVEFLEQQLGDRSLEVRKRATLLLCQIPESRLSRHVLDQIHTCLAADGPQASSPQASSPPASSPQAPLPSTLQAPPALDDAIASLGADAKSTLSDAERRLVGLIRALPAAHWQSTFGLALDTLLTAPQAAPQAALLEGLRLAALDQRDPPLIQALLLGKLEPEALRLELFNQLDDPGKNIVLLALADQNLEQMLALLTRSPQIWTPELSDRILEWLGDWLARPQRDWHWVNWIESSLGYQVSLDRIPAALHLFQSYLQSEAKQSPKTQRSSDDSQNQYLSQYLKQAIAHCDQILKFRRDAIAALAP